MRLDPLVGAAIPALKGKRLETNILIFDLQSEPCERLNWVVPREAPPVPWMDGSFVYKVREERAENREQ
jgi:hypothetical protein